MTSLYVVTPQQSLSDVLSLMAGRYVNQVPVVDNGVLVGILSRDAIVHYLEVRLWAAGGDWRRTFTPLYGSLRVSSEIDLLDPSSILDLSVSLDEIALAMRRWISDGQ